MEIVADLREGFRERGLGLGQASCFWMTGGTVGGVGGASIRAGGAQDDEDKVQGAVGCPAGVCTYLRGGGGLLGRSWT